MPEHDDVSDLEVRHVQIADVIVFGHRGHPRWAVERHWGRAARGPANPIILAAARTLGGRGLGARFDGISCTSGTVSNLVAKMT